MARPSFKKHTPSATARASSGEHRAPRSKKHTPRSEHRLKSFKQRVKSLGRRIKMLRERVKTFRARHLHLHKSFRRSYREDYLRPTETPGLMHHAMLTFKTLGQHWKTFALFILLMLGLYILMVGLMSEDFYQQFQTAIDTTSEEMAIGNLGNFAKAGLLLISTVTSGGLDVGMDTTQTVFTVILFLIMWLVTVYLLRHFLAGKRPKLRDALYNALAPLLSTFVIFAVIFVQAIPIMLVIITYSAAVMTNFLATPFYALLYFIFAALMILLSAYAFSSSLIALVAVTTPGMYPFTALFAASDLMAGRRIKFILRLVFLIFVAAIIYIIVMMPVILLDLWLKSMWNFIASWPIVPFFLLATTCFVFIYLATYIYIYYRWLLDYKEK